MVKTSQKNNLITVLFAVILLVSCDSKRVFDSYVSVPSGIWEIDSTLVFNFSVEDTLARRNLFINLRNNSHYPFSNLFLVTKLKLPSGEQIVDTLEYEMADVTGQFLGKGFSEIKENKLFYKESITFPSSGKYSLSIAQAMRKNGDAEGIAPLEGITDVGFRIEKIEQ
ncbi:gliding motility lipoprotein GldH [Tenacibaculum aquimarinum]|uniref:gliding motility lipoprotein GldH n=1 Tax=Tenacibaculum aquimarinum TaxID=2910675 RepID=UPI001F0AB8B3|nr:gliding motility lipoprotein GldH [Tenacibaculum aquimarinum]MCH3883850.1 gliding motility lipoprotein GldH [Tenacibaculum aquimarinum]